MNNWQYELAAAKQTANVDESGAQPAWLGNVTLAQQYGAHIDELLTKLPMMIQVTSQPARQAYFDTVVKELIHLTYVQARIAQLSGKPIDPTVDHTAALIKQLADWLQV